MSKIVAICQNEISSTMSHFIGSHNKPNHLISRKISMEAQDKNYLHIYVVWRTYKFNSLT